MVIFVIKINQRSFISKSHALIPQTPLQQAGSFLKLPTGQFLNGRPSAEARKGAYFYLLNISSLFALAERGAGGVSTCYFASNQFFPVPQSTFSGMSSSAAFDISYSTIFFSFSSSASGTSKMSSS